MQHDFILLDRSGSMGGTMWTEALGAINGYVKKLADDNIDTGVTLAVFDSNEPFKIIRDRITPKTWRPVTNDDAMPRGGTPLNDATNELIALAERGPPWGGQYEKVAIVIMTDGNENASQEYSARFGGTEKIKSRLDQCRARGWVVQMLGAGFDNQAQATAYGATRGATIQTSAVNLGATMGTLASKRGIYSTTTAAGAAAAATMDWMELEQDALKSDKAVKPEDLQNKTYERNVLKSDI